MSRIGVHVKTGPRNGYGLVCEAKPAVVFAAGEGGALKDAVEKSQGYSWRIYRSLKYYNNHPENMGLNDPNLTREEAYEIADMFFPLLLEDWELNPADFYAVINESGANDTTVIKNYVNYEWRMIERAEEVGKKLCLCNLFSGTPDDGSVAGFPPNGGIETWKHEYGPLLARGFAGGHIYGRHVYGYPMLVPLDFNSDRPFREIEWLIEQKIPIGVALTECGLHGGEFQPDKVVVLDQMAKYDELMEVFNKWIIGAAWWTYGDWSGAGGGTNLQIMSPDLAAYLNAHPSDRWVPIDYEPPMQQEPNRIKHTIHLLPQDATPEERQAIVEYLAPTNTAFTHSHDVVDAVMFHSTPEGTINVWAPQRWNFDTRDYFSWLKVNYKERQFSEITDGDEDDFSYEYWPVDNTPYVTQHWANDPAYYKQFCDTSGMCLPGHDGVDIRAPGGTKVRTVADGEVVRAHLFDDGHNYGIHVYILHKPFNELTGYAHLRSASVLLGQKVLAGQVIGIADNTGNSRGDHLHFLRKRPGETYEDEHGTWPWELHDPTPYLKPLAPGQFPSTPPPLPTKYDLSPYFSTGAAKGMLYEVQTEGAGQQRHQTQYENGIIYHTKDSEWEQIKFDSTKCYRSVDTSPGSGQYYEIMDVPGTKWSIWCPRYMYEGESYYRNPFVQFRVKSNCALVSEGYQASLLVLEEVIKEMTFFTGITLTDVIELVWTGLDHTPIERYYYARGYGLVGWEGNGKRAAISEIHQPGARPDNVREVIRCL